MAANEYFEYLKQQEDGDYPDPCYALVPDIVKMYAKVPQEKLTVQDLTVLYMMTIFSHPDGKGRSQVQHKIEDVQKSHLEDKDKGEIISRLEKYAKIEDNKHIGLFAIARQRIGEEGSYRNNTDAAQFILLCLDILNYRKEDEILKHVSLILPRLKLPGVGMGIVSQILHCLNPRVFPVLNSPGVKNYKELLGLTLSKKGGFEGYIENIQIIQKFRDKNFSFKNYRIIDAMGWEIQEWEKGEPRVEGQTELPELPEQPESKEPVINEQEEIVGLMASDSTGWQEQYIQEIKKKSHDAAILWNSKTPSGTDETLKKLRERLEKRGSFYLYYTAQGQVQYRARIIEFVTNQSELDSKNWSQEYSIYRYSDNFNDHFNQNLKARILFLAKAIEKIEPLPVSEFTFYGGFKAPRQDNISPVATVPQEMVVLDTSEDIQGGERTVDPKSDYPATVDQLRRSSFAESIAKKMNYIWEDNRDSKVEAPVMLHLHGPWGSGKTSLINFIIGSLKQLDISVQPNGVWRRSHRWKFVHFNAWQNQHIDPPWWALYSEIFHKGFSWPYRYWINFTSYLKHLVTGKGPYVLALTVVSGFIFYIARETDYYSDTFSLSVPDLLKVVNGTFTLFGTLFTLFLAFGKELFHSSAKNATQYIYESQTPMSAIREKFKTLMSKLDNPTLVVIDDMDRCHTEYTVKLLEGIQTLFASKNVIYLVAADRRWLYSCYEKVYADFRDHIREPGKQLGAHFLEKAFEFSFPIPGIPNSIKEEYWSKLIGIQEPDPGGEEDNGEDHEGNNEPKTRRRQTGQVQNEMRRREQLVQELSERQALQATEHFLRQFAHLVEPNPRSMKRLLNAYTIQRDLAILMGVVRSGQNPELENPESKNEKLEKQLVLFTIVTLRWPSLERALVKNPALADVIAELAEKKSNISAAKKEIISVEEPEIQKLIIDPEVQKVFQGEQLGEGGEDVRLDTKVVELFLTLQNEGKVESSVA